MGPWVAGHDLSLTRSLLFSPLSTISWYVLVRADSLLFSLFPSRMYLIVRLANFANVIVIEVRLQPTAPCTNCITKLWLLLFRDSSPFSFPSFTASAFSAFLCVLRKRTLLHFVCLRTSLEKYHTLRQTRLVIMQLFHPSLRLCSLFFFPFIYWSCLRFYSFLSLPPSFSIIIITVRASPVSLVLSLKCWMSPSKIKQSVCFSFLFAVQSIAASCCHIFVQAWLYNHCTKVYAVGLSLSFKVFLCGSFWELTRRQWRLSS